MQQPPKFESNRIVWGYSIKLPQCPKKEQIANYDIPQKDQKFIRQPLPTDLRLWTPEKRKEYIAREWDRRINGYWFYNNGNIEYMTGLQYFYCNWWKIGNQYPMWTDMNRDFFYIWNMCENDMYCDGLVFVSYRGSGKTILSTVITYEPISRKYGVNASFQSKTDGDAKKIFKRLISSWQRLPTFFKPLDTGENRPTTTLDFSEPSKRDTKQLNKDAQDFLGSMISYAASSESALDGDNLHRVVIDEFAKSFNVDTVERLKVVRETLRAGRSQYGRGKILNTSTVEESEKKGTVNSRKIWDDANPLNRDDNGFTKNGMYRIFVPATEGYLEVIAGESFIDDYGYSLREKAKEFFLKKRAGLKGADLNSEKRKYPLEEKDMWVSDTKVAIYDTYKIEQQIEWNNYELDGDVNKKGNFYWIDGIRFGKVGWNHDKNNGKWLLNWMPKPEQRNKWVIKNGRKSPANLDLSCAGLDPYDSDTTADESRMSDAAGYVFRKFDPLNPYETGTFASEYVNRPKTADIMFEDMLMQAIFFGHEILIENNKIGAINFFKRHGFQNYLMRRPEETQTANSKKMLDDYGIPMSGAEARQALIYATESYIIANVGLVEEEGQEPRMGKCYFNKLLDNWLSYDADDEWTKYDSMVGAGLALLGARKYMPIKREIKSIGSLPKYNTSGKMSVLIPQERTKNEEPIREEVRHQYPIREQEEQTEKKPKIQNWDIPLRKY